MSTPVGTPMSGQTAIVEALQSLAPGAQWALGTDNLADLQWLDPIIPRPSDSAITAQAALSVLLIYANGKQWGLATGGYTATFGGGSPYTFDTSEQGYPLIMGKYLRLSAPNPPTTISWQTGPTTFVSMTAAQFSALSVAIDDFMQATFDVIRNTVEPGITGGTITTTAQIDAAPWPSNQGSF